MGREIRKSEEARVPHAPRSGATQTAAAAAAAHGGPGGAKIVSAVGFPLVRSSASDGAGATTSAITPAGSAPIKYHGGPVVVGAPTVNIYHICYGSWGSGSGKRDRLVRAGAEQRLGQPGQGGGRECEGVVGHHGRVLPERRCRDEERELQGETCAPYMCWFSPVHNHLSPLTGAHARSTTCTRAVSPSPLSSHPRAANHPPAAARAVVKSKLGAGKPLALDPQGLYVVLTSVDVTLGGFCSEYCGWHTQDSLNSTPLRYAFVGHHGQCPDACGVESTSPNGKPATDATISTLAHELTEAATDPNTNAGWFDDNGEENADKCSWDYGSTKRGSLQNGQSYEYNLVGLNGMKFLVQLNWDRMRSKCILQNALPADSSGGGGTPSPPSPPPPPPPTGGSVKMKCDCNCASASNPMSCQCSCTKTG
ncbi:unnamed protein product [Closterium sp. Naga37s-1]|nr:unnamed protein product [Closterium sp. Naga37s-1]